MMTKTLSSKKFFCVVAALFAAATAFNMTSGPAVGASSGLAITRPASIDSGVTSMAGVQTPR